jgi:hypothetical protein
VKIKLSKSQWEFVGQKTGWIKTIKTIKTAAPVVKHIPVKKLKAPIPPLQKLDPQQRAIVDKNLKGPIIQNNLVGNPELKDALSNQVGKGTMLNTFEAVDAAGASKAKAINKIVEKTQAQIYEDQQNKKALQTNPAKQVEQEKKETQAEPLDEGNEEKANKQEK